MAHSHSERPPKAEITFKNMFKIAVLKNTNAMAVPYNFRDQADIAKVQNLHAAPTVSATA